MATLPKVQSRPQSRPKARRLSGALEGTPTRSCPHVYIHQSKHTTGTVMRRGTAVDTSGCDSVRTGGNEAERMDPLRHLQHFSTVVESRVVAFFEASENFPCKRIGNYLLGKKLGEGAFAKVRLGIHRPTGQKVAVKIYSKDRQSDSYVLQNISREAKLMIKMRHPNIIQLLDMNETENNYYFVMEACMKGSLLDVVESRVCLTPEEAREYTVQLVSAVGYLHSSGIIHRDIKLDNLLLTDSGVLKLIDFGLSNTLGSQTLCGSPLYAAPEVLGAKHYGKEVDVWSIGACLFIMLMGYPPYKPENAGMAKLHANMMMGRMSRIKESLSVNCQDLILKLLQYDPKQRITIPAILAHPWITMNGLQPVRVVPVPNWLREQDLDPAILGFIGSDDELSCGLSLEQIAQDLQENKATAATANYHLLVRHFQEVMKEERRKTVRRSASDYNLSSVDRTGLQSKQGRRRRHVSEDQLPPLASQTTQPDDQGMANHPGGVVPVPKLHHNDCSPKALSGPAAKQQAPASDDQKLAFSRRIPPMDLKHVPRERRSMKSSGCGTRKDHTAMDSKQLAKIAESPLAHPAGETHDPHGSELQCSALPNATSPPSADILISKLGPQYSRISAAMPPITASFGAEQEPAATKRWLWKRPEPKSVKDYDSSLSDTDSSRTQGSGLCEPNDLTTAQE